MQVWVASSHVVPSPQKSEGGGHATCATTKVDVKQASTMKIVLRIYIRY